MTQNSRTQDDKYKTHERFQLPILGDLREIRYRDEPGGDVQMKRRKEEKKPQTNG